MTSHLLLQSEAAEGASPRRFFPAVVHVTPSSRQRNDLPETSNLLTAQSRQLAKSDCSLGRHADESRSPTGEATASHPEPKRVGSFAEVFDRGLPDRSSPRIEGRSPVPGPAVEIPISMGDSTVPQPVAPPRYGRRPSTHEEEMRDELDRLRKVVFQLHRRLVDERESSRTLAERMEVRDGEFREAVEGMRRRHDEKLRLLRDKAVLALGRCSDERSALEREVEADRAAWLAERKNLEARIEQLQSELQRFATVEKETEAEAEVVEDQTDVDMASRFSGPQEGEQLHERLSQQQQQQQQSSDVDGWDGLYRTLYEISVGQLRALEERRQVKNEFGKSLSDYGYFKLFSDLVSNCSVVSNCSESNRTDPCGSATPPPNPTVRRSSSCPDLPDGAPEASQSSDRTGDAPEKSENPSVLRSVVDRPSAPRPVSIPLLGFVDSRGTSDSPSPIQDTPSIFSRQKLQYRHVCRQPRRALERQEKSLPLVKSISNSLPSGRSASSLKAHSHSSLDDNQAGVGAASAGGKIAVQSNFERLCHRRNGLINPDFRSSKLAKGRHTNVIDKLGQNLRQYIGREQRGGS